MEQTIKERQLAFLEETANHYNKDNRSSDKTGCYYSPKTKGLVGKSQGCAIGRKLSEELAVELDKKCLNHGVNSQKVFNLLPKEVQELGMDFLVIIQTLHDVDYNWDENGLTGTGESNVKKIKDDFELWPENINSPSE